MISKRLIWYSEKLSWWLAGEMYCKLSERVGKVWKELSLMLADGGVRKEIEVCQSCRTCEDRDDANYHKLPSSTLSLYVPHHPSQCCILYQRLNFAKLTRWCICHGNRHQLDQLERWSKSRAFNRINDFTWYCIQLLHRISLDNSRKNSSQLVFFNHGQLGNWDHAFLGSLPTFHWKGLESQESGDSGIGYDKLIIGLSKSCWNSPAEARAYGESPWFYGSYQNLDAGWSYFSDRDSNNLLQNKIHEQVSLLWKRCKKKHAIESKGNQENWSAPSLNDFHNSLP